MVAAPDQLDDVLRVLDEAAAWLRDRGIEQWPARFDPAWVRGSVERRETRLVQVDGQVCATVTLDWADTVWDEIPGNAAYLHRMAVRRQSAGLGRVILAWAADAAREHGRDALRLDCVASNRRLRAYYEAAGFAFRGDATVAGAPGQRLAAGPVTVVSRYELPLDALRLASWAADPSAAVAPPSAAVAPLMWSSRARGGTIAVAITTAVVPSMTGPDSSGGATDEPGQRLSDGPVTR